MAHLRWLWSPFADLDLAVPETTRLDSSLHKARAQLLAKGRRHRPSRSRLRDSASSAEDGEGSDGPGGKVGVTYTHPHHTPGSYTLPHASREVCPWRSDRHAPKGHLAIHFWLLYLSVQEKVLAHFTDEAETRRVRQVPLTVGCANEAGSLHFM